MKSILDKIVLIAAVAAVALTIYLLLSHGSARDRELAALKARVDALQLVASGKVNAPVIDSVQVIRPKVIKPEAIKY